MLNWFPLIVFQVVGGVRSLIEVDIFEIEVAQFVTSRLFEEAELAIQCFCFEGNVERERFTLAEYRLFSILLEDYQLGLEYSRKSVYWVGFEKAVH